MSIRLLTNTGLAIMLLAAAPAAAAVTLSDAAGRYAIAPAGSSLRFSIDGVGGSGMQGRFGQFSGSVRIDPSDVGRSEVDFTIFPDSVATGQGRVDAFLKSDAVFDTANEKKIVFRSTSVRRTGDTTAEVTGRLTARGKSGTEKFTVALESADQGSLHFRVTGKVLRSRYGMDVGTPIYSNVVDFDTDFSASRR
ncbi:MAG: polyisoprenoid-binding protein [Rhizobiaceae bacterium]|nr:polyisoprenoid-binding protein [Rhizobiaceae bacterium]